MTLIALGAAALTAALAGCSSTSTSATAPAGEHTASGAPAAVTAPATTSAAAAPATAAPSATAASGAPVVTPEACRAAGLPPLTITSTGAARGMIVSAAPDKDRWLVFSGPPGGPLGLEVRRAASEADVIPADQRTRGDFAAGKTGKAQLAGAEWSVQTWITGESLARAAHLALWRKIGGTIVVIDANWGGKDAPEPGLDAVRADLRGIMDGLTITAPQ